MNHTQTFQNIILLMTVNRDGTLSESLYERDLARLPLLGEERFEGTVEP